jgi:hypothetical protein
VADLWPSIVCTTVTFAPAAIASEAAVCRSACGVSGAGPADATAGSKPERRKFRMRRTRGWCGGPIDTKRVGRIPKWCSPACRQRAWEQSRAAASGRAAVKIVERVVHVAVEHAERPRQGGWPQVLRELAAQLDSGRIYPPDLPDLGAALSAAFAAYERRRSARSRA